MSVASWLVTPTAWRSHGAGGAGSYGICMFVATEPETLNEISNFSYLPIEAGALMSLICKPPGGGGGGGGCEPERILRLLGACGTDCALSDPLP